MAVVKTKAHSCGCGENKRHTLVGVVKNKRHFCGSGENKGTLLWVW